MIYTVDQLEQSFTMEKWLSWALKDRPTKTKFERQGPRWGRKNPQESEGSRPTLRA